MSSCSHCAKPVAKASAICPHCGRPARTVKPRQTHDPVRCPGCDGEGDVVLFGQSHLDLCRRCSGLWFDRGELREFGDSVFADDLQVQLGEVLRELQRRAPPPSKRAYLKCPVCAQAMTKHNYASVSGILIHTCSAHGSWADHKASLGLVELFGEGGEARLREIAERQDKDALDRTLQRIQARQTALEQKTRSLDARTRIHLLLDWFNFL